MSGQNSGKDEKDGRLKIIEDILKGRGVKLTNQRREIIELLANAKEHMRAEDIYDSLKDRGIGLATVYRNLELLRSNGVVTEISHGKYRYYELRMFSSKCTHVHFRCDSCGKIEDIVDKDIIFDIIKMKNELETRYDLKIEDYSFILSGKCKNCKE